MANTAEPSQKLIWTRTQEDVVRARQIKAKYPNLTEVERGEWESGLLGALNASDWNRLYAWANYITSEMAKRISNVTILQQKVWFPTREDTTGFITVEKSDVAAFQSAMQTIYVRMVARNQNYRGLWRQADMLSTTNRLENLNNTEHNLHIANLCLKQL